MKVRDSFFVIAALLFTASVGAQEVQIIRASNLALRQELLDLQEVDQRVRLAKPNEPAAWKEVDLQNLAQLKVIVEKNGWPTISMVSKDGALAAFLIAQHANSDPDFQRRVLAMMEPMLKTGEVESPLYAYLYDRTHTPQRYGTQGTCAGKGKWTPRAIEAPAKVDERRAAIKMVPLKLAEYAAWVGEKSCP